MDDTLRRELRVAFSRKAQPVWFRLGKWIAIIAFCWLMWGHPYFWPVLFGAFVLGLLLHFFWRWKTKRWTQPWGGWDDVV